MNEDLGSFQVVCPVCTTTFTLDDEVIAKGWDSENAEEYLKIVCPACGCVRCPKLPEEEG